VEVELLFGIPTAAVFYICMYVYCRSNCQTWLMTYKWQVGAGLKWHLKDILMPSTLQRRLCIVCAIFTPSFK